MKTKLLQRAEGQRVYAVVFDIGEEVGQGLVDFAGRERLGGSYFTGIGALEKAVLGYWVADGAGYQANRIDEQVEVLSITGTIALLPDGAPKVHAHMVLGRRDGSAWGGHLMEAHVRPTLEIVLTESVEQLRRRHDAATHTDVLDLS